MLKMASLILGIFSFLMISPALPGQDVVLSIPSSSGARGDMVAIPVSIGDVTGREVISVEMTIRYDIQALSVIDADVSGTMAETWLISSNTTTPGEIIVSMAGADPLSGSGPFVNVNFLVQPTAQVGTTYQISFTRAILNDGTPGVVTQGGSFTVEFGPAEDRMEGDANGDDRVNHLDLLRLILAYNKKSGDNGYSASADFNGDGRVDKQDMIILWRNFGARR